MVEFELQGFGLWGATDGETYVDHHCGSTAPVMNLEAAVRWAVTHQCAQQRIEQKPETD